MDTHRRNQFAATSPRPSAFDGALILGGLLLVVLAHVVGRAIEASGTVILLPFPPIFATWAPHVGVGTVPAVLCLVAAVRLEQHAGAMSWRGLLTVGWMIGLAWTVSLASVDGDWGTKMLSPHEYLHDLPRIEDPWEFLRTFSGLIVGVPDAWTTHVSAHPPLATLVFWALAWVGLGGGWWAGLACMIAGSLAGPAWAVTLRALGTEASARRLVPWLAVFPGAVWMGVSGDALFAGVASVGVAAAVWGAVHARPVVSLVGGLLLGAMLYLSYGHVLYVLVVATSLVLSSRHVGWRRVRWGWLVTGLGAGAVVIFFTAAGFVWWQGLARVNLRYYEGIASSRPYSYFVWGNLAALVVCASPLVVVMVRWAISRVASPNRSHADSAPAWLALAALLVIVLADLSGLSKAETERIWLTFTLTLYCAASLAPPSWGRWGLIGAASWALAVNHLLLTEW